MTTRNAIHADAAPEPNGNYSHVIRYGDKLYLCGWMGDDPKTGEIVEGGIVAQTVTNLPHEIIDSLRLSLTTNIRDKL